MRFKKSKIVGFIFLFLFITQSFAAQSEPPKDETAPKQEVTSGSEVTTANEAPSGNEATPDTNTQDPFERLNRAVFKFNDVLDTYILKPVCNIYDKVTPKPLAKGLSNFFNNIDTIPTIFNDLLQGNFYQATSDTWRFAINSTVGILGFIDVASHIGLESNTEDFGLTLAHWGWKNSYYIVVPFYGPATVRDALGWPVNYYGLSIYPYINPVRDRVALYLLSVVVRRSDLLQYENVFEQVAIDKYVFVRDAYLQHRNYLIDRNKELADPYLNKNNLEEADKKSAEIPP